MQIQYYFISAILLWLLICLTYKQLQQEGSENEDDDEEEKAQQKYVPPKVSAMHFGEPFKYFIIITAVHRSGFPYVIVNLAYVMTQEINEQCR